MPFQRGREPHENCESHRSDRRPGAARRHVRSPRHRLDEAPVSAQQLSHHQRGAAGDDPLARPAQRALEPAAERSRRRGRRGDAVVVGGPRRAAGRCRQRLRPRRRRRRRHRAVVRRAGRRRGRGRGPVGEPHPRRAAAEARAPARGARALRAPVRRGGARLPPHDRPGSGQAARGARPGRVAGTRDHRQDGRRAGSVHPHARRRRRRQGVDARDERRRHLAADGPLLRLQRRGDAGPRRRRDAARRRQARAAGAAAPPRGQLLAQRGARLRGARRDGPGAGAPHGPLRRSDGGDRAAPRARRRQRLPGQAQQRPDDDGGAHRRPRQPLRQPVQSAPAGAGDDAARIALAAVRAGTQQVRHLDPRRVHQDDGRLPAGLDGAAHRRPLRAGRRRQLVASAQAERARPRRGDAARGSAGARPRDGGRPRHPTERAARPAAADRARLPRAERARQLLLRAVAAGRRGE